MTSLRSSSACSTRRGGSSNRERPPRPAPRPPPPPPRPPPPPPPPPLRLERPRPQVAGGIKAAVDVGQPVGGGPRDPGGLGQQLAIASGHPPQLGRVAVELELVGELRRVAAQHDELHGAGIPDRRLGVLDPQPLL